MHIKRNIMNVGDALCTNAWRVNSFHQKGIRNLGQVISFTARQCIANPGCNTETSYQNAASWNRAQKTSTDEGEAERWRWLWVMEKHQEKAQGGCRAKSWAMEPLSCNEEDNFKAGRKLVVGEYLKNRILTEVGKSLKFFLTTLLCYNAMQKRPLRLLQNRLATRRN